MLYSFSPSRPVIAILVVFFALSSTNDGLHLVRSFAPIRQNTIIRPGHPAVHVVTHHRSEGYSSSFGIATATAAATTARRESQSQSRLRLEAVPPSLWWILGHVTLASTGVPIVTKATRNGGWYRKIDLPPWTPPDKLFGPVWTSLYACMGLALSRISKLSASSPTTTITSPLILLWAIHFGINLAWAPVFFGLQRFRLGLILSYLMLGSLAVIIPLFHAVDPISAFLLLPYAFWLSFATFGLNVAICRRNPTKNGYNEGMFQAQLRKLQDNAAAYAGV